MARHYTTEKDKAPIFYTTDEGTIFDDAQNAQILDSLRQYVDQCTSDLCVSCGATLNMGKVDMYEHDGGWVIAKGTPRHWLSIKCSSCGYEVSLTKLGVPR